MRSVVIIPARYDSSRFPGKPLVSLLGKPMIIWVAELSAKAVGKENVYIATEDQRICEVVIAEEFNVILTSKEALTGTDRIAEAALKIEADIYINVQGDEPLVNPDDILKILEAKKKYFNKIINGFTWIDTTKENASNINIPKVITNENDILVYMSRSIVPAYKDIRNKPLKYKKQVCIYAFTYDELKSYFNFGRKSELEKFEDIEILRFFELGKEIKMVETQSGSLAVDTPEDVLQVEEALRNMRTL